MEHWVRQPHLPAKTTQASTRSKQALPSSAPQCLSPASSLHPRKVRTSDLRPHRCSSSSERAELFHLLSCVSSDPNPRWPRNSRRARWLVLVIRWHGEWFGQCISNDGREL